MNIQIIAEIMGTVAFAISGAMLAIERKMDLFGIVFLGIVTAAGGGFIRDMTLGIVPPAMFSSPMVLPLAILSSLAVCALVAWLYKGSDEELHGERFQWILNFTDAIGLGLFTVAGANTAIDSGYGDLSCLCGFSGNAHGCGRRNVPGRAGRNHACGAQKACICLRILGGSDLLPGTFMCNAKRICHVCRCCDCGCDPSVGKSL